MMIVRYHHHDDDSDSEGEVEHESFRCYFWKKYKLYCYVSLLFLVLGIPIFMAGGRYSHKVKEPICGCEADKEYCCPSVFNNPDSGAVTKCHANQCYCYKRNPFTDLRTGNYFCMPLEESQSFETKFVEEHCPILMFIGSILILLGVFTLTCVFESIPSEQRNHDSLEAHKEMSALESRIRVAAAAMRKASHTTNCASGKKSEYQRLQLAEDDVDVKEPQLSRVELV